ncbi:hypothetical protein [Pseudanabaena sp. PCC 6802]|uniref:hypothetical protein n=1 Tax=Pseudanabaena sp. PCC 6802 TaxID=118173 RepID=UPI00037322EB|nr:hypothetical protein [Pseudanabaena sp. PCC 6802]
MAQQLSMLELAQQGNAEAIAALIDRSLLPKGITTSAALQGDCLEISLQSLQVPNQKAVVALIRKGMETLQVEAIKQVRILSFRGSSGIVAWNTEFDLAIDASATTQPNRNTDLSEPREPLQIQSTQQPSAPPSDRQSPQSSQSIILSNASPLVQHKQRFQEYQDIIIRFIDESSGAVRCVATLTELLQMISRSNFSFSDLASSPTLRTLLDAIAEFSHTDRNGDLIVSSISILQPGQSWQKARIRLATKVLFEAEDYDPPPISYPGAITLEVLDTTEKSSASKPSSNDVETSSRPQASIPVTEPDLEPVPDKRDPDSTLKPPAQSKDDTLDDWFDDLDATSSPQSDAPRQAIITSRTVLPLLDDSGISSSPSHTSKSTSQSTAPDEENISTSSTSASSTPDVSASAVSTAPKSRTSSRSDRRAAMTLDDLTNIDELGDAISSVPKTESKSAKTSTGENPETLDDFSAMW